MAVGISGELRRLGAADLLARELKRDAAIALDQNRCSAYYFKMRTSQWIKKLGGHAGELFVCGGTVETGHSERAAARKFSA
jgi:hypothetical protein